MDHVPALSVLSNLREAEIDVSYLRKYPACRECNSILGACPILSIPERRDIVRERLRKKYRKLLQVPRWDEEELSELDPHFAQYVRASVAAAEIAKRRTRWIR
jgi:hypothetical protein